MLDMIAQIQMSEIPETFESLLIYYFINLFFLVDANHCFLEPKKLKKLERSSLLIMRETNHFSDGILGVIAFGLMNSSIMLCI